MKDKVNITIEDGDSFFSNETSINHNPTQFILDFKCITPRTDPRVQQGVVMNIKHNTVVMEVFHAKMLHGILGQALQNYEKQYGEIVKPEAVKKQEEMTKNKPKQPDTVPSYFG